MAEIVIRCKHEDLPQRWSLALLRLSFPIWGIIAPIVLFVFLCCWLSFIYNLMIHSSWAVDLLSKFNELIPLIGYTLCLFAIPAGALCIMRTLTSNNLVLEKNGIIFPIESFRFRYKRYLPWQKVSKIQVLNSSAHAQDSSGWAGKRIVFFKTDGKRDKLDLKYYSAAELEQILVAMETWGKEIEFDESVSTLHKQLRLKQSSQSGQSYTDMWEDELRRRYNPTAFVPLDPGLILRDGRLKVLRQLATGGLSAIYLCQLENKKLVVLKEAVLPEDAVLSVKNKASELFAREAELLARIDHPDIVKVLDYFVEGGRNYLLMDYIPGQDLRQFVKQNGAQRESTVVDWGIQIVGLMKYLHELDPPIIHRDLTPDNLVLREDGKIVLIDFGAANEFISKGTGTFVGKQSFISPEQFRGKACTQSDIYAFGCTLFYLLTAKEPEALETSSPRACDPKISDELDELVQSCTQLEARDRFQSASQLLPVLRKIAASLLGVL